MNVKDEKIEIVHLDRDATGTKIEPEQQPARRLLDVSEPVNIGTGVGEGEAKKTPFVMPTFISAEMTAQQMAEGFSKPCGSCRHFNRRRAVECRHRWMQSPDSLVLVQEYTAELPDLETLGPEKAWTEKMGVCELATEVAQEVVLFHEAATCPAEITDYYMHKHAFGDHFSPDDRATEKKSANVKDLIMRTAEGKAP